MEVYTFKSVYILFIIARVVNWFACLVWSAAWLFWLLYTIPKSTSVIQQAAIAAYAAAAVVGAYAMCRASNSILALAGNAIQRLQAKRKEVKKVRSKGRPFKQW